MAKRTGNGEILLRSSAEGDGYSTLDLVNGLNGVCIALDSMASETSKGDVIHPMTMAAKILSTILADRVEV